MIRLFRKTIRRVSHVPPGTRIYAIGDVHGCLAETDRLLGMIERDNAARGPAETQVVFLGDLVDRGPDSAGVVERLRTLAPDWATPRYVMGNHEELLLQALEDKREALKVFVRAGGRETMLSYGMSAEDFDAATWDEMAEAMAPHVPAAHREFLAGMEKLIVAGDYALVHAGIRPGVPLDEQQPSDLLWIREPFLSHRGDLGHVVVHGHTVTDAVDERPSRIGIDTGAYASGRLTAIGLEGAERWFLSTLD